MTYDDYHSLMVITQFVLNVFKRKSSFQVLTLFVFISLTMAYGIGRNIALLVWRINRAEFL